ncbi:MoaF-related domain-containing protein [Leucobacter sp. USHLN153]|uniref:MoaF-related domain-containing protein n=1 Tax=Leucobacter sp. USHLN153 TaxID=3081268 RepID=UPI003018CB01
MKFSMKKDEQDGDKLKNYPALGEEIFIDFGDSGPFGPFAVKIAVAEEGNRLTYLVTRGSLLDKTETCEYHAVPVADGVWMVSWREGDGLTVVQVQDFERGTLESVVTTPENELFQFGGTLEVL